MLTFRQIFTDFIDLVAIKSLLAMGHVCLRLNLVAVANEFAEAASSRLNRAAARVRALAERAGER
jgi:hypothetical protein